MPADHPVYRPWWAAHIPGDVLPEAPLLVRVYSVRRRFAALPAHSAVVSGCWIGWTIGQPHWHVAWVTWCLNPAGHAALTQLIGSLLLLTIRLSLAAGIGIIAYRLTKEAWRPAA